VGELGTEDETVLTGVQSLPVNQGSTLSVHVGPVSVKDSGPKAKVSSGKVEIKWQNLTKTVWLQIPRADGYLIDIIRSNGDIAISRKVKGPGEFSISIPHLESGVYLVKCISGNKTVSKTIMAVK